jgi:1-acyl-sn-glycerol-3-phosphate acyltransferase
MSDASTPKTARRDSLLSFALERPGHYLWGLFADLGIFVATIVCATLAILAALLTRSGRPIDVMGRIWCRLIVVLCGIRIDVEGLEHLERGRSYILVSNHLSNFDIWCTAAVVPFWVHFVAKKELLRVPFFGQALALSNHIVIDRQNPESAIERINTAVARTPEGICILFYAEGTRSPDGKVHEFKKGGVTLGIRTGLPLVPMSISGTRKFLPKRCVVIRPGGGVKIVFDRPIETKGLELEVRDELNARVRERVVANFIEEY